MFGNQNNNFMLDRLMRQKEEIDNLIRNYQNTGQQTPVNNFINTNQTQDSNSRQLQSTMAMVNDSILNNKYDNAILIKDLSNQMSNSVAALGNQIANQTATITNLFNEQTIDRLRDQVTVLRGQNSNLVQTAEITQNILGNLATVAPKPPCYYNCGCGCNGLY